MFDVGESNRIIITQGDTGVLAYVPQTDMTFAPSDYAVFVAKQRNGTPLAKLTIQIEEKGLVRIPFPHDMTKAWPAGRHEWQLRYFIGEGPDEVSTPMEVGTLEVLRAI